MHRGIYIRGTTFRYIYREAREAREFLRRPRMEAQRGQIKELLERPPQGLPVKRPSRISEDDLPFIRPAEKPARPCLFTSEAELEEEEDQNQQGGSGRSLRPPRATTGPSMAVTRGAALPLPANRTRYYESDAVAKDDHAAEDCD